MELKIFFDYCCPFCYLGHAYIKQVIGRHPNISVRWCPCEAHPRSEPRMIVSSRGAPSWWAHKQEEAKKAGITVKAPYSPVPHSDLAIQAMYYVAEHGGDIWNYHDAVYEAVFTHARNIEELSVIADCLTKIGVEAQGFIEALQNGEYCGVSGHANKYAYEEHRVWAVPSYVCGSRRLDSVENMGVSKEELQNFLLSL